MTDDDRIFRFDHRQKHISQSADYGCSSALVVTGSLRDNATPNACIACRRWFKLSSYPDAASKNVTAVAAPTAAAAAAAHAISYQQMQLFLCVTSLIVRTVVDWTFHSGMTMLRFAQFCYRASALHFCVWNKLPKNDVLRCVLRYVVCYLAIKPCKICPCFDCDILR